MEKRFTINEIRQYLLHQHSLSEAIYNLTGIAIENANAPQQLELYPYGKVCRAENREEGYIGGKDLDNCI